MGSPALVCVVKQRIGSAVAGKLGQALFLLRRTATRWIAGGSRSGGVQTQSVSCRRIQLVDGAGGGGAAGEVLMRRTFYER